MECSPTISSSFPVCVVCHEAAVAPIRTCGHGHLMCYQCLVQYFNSKYPEHSREDSLVLPCPMCRADGPRSVVFSRPGGFEPTPGVAACLALEVNRFSARELAQIYGRDTPSWWRCGFCSHSLPSRIQDAYASILQCPNQPRHCHKPGCTRPDYAYKDGFLNHKLQRCDAIRCQICHRLATFTEQQRHFPRCRDLFGLANDLSISADRLSLFLIDGSLDEPTRYSLALELFQRDGIIEKLLSLHSALVSALSPSLPSSSSSSSSSPPQGPSSSRC